MYIVHIWHVSMQRTFKTRTVVHKNVNYDWNKHKSDLLWQSMTVEVILSKMKCLRIHNVLVKTDGNTSRRSFFLDVEELTFLIRFWCNLGHSILHPSPNKSNIYQMQFQNYILSFNISKKICLSIILRIISIFSRS